MILTGNSMRRARAGAGEDFSALLVDLEAEWKCNGDATDSIGSNDFTPVNNMALTTDENGDSNKAYSLDGTGDYGIISSPDSALAPGTHITIGAYIYLNSLPSSDRTGVPCIIARWGTNDCWFLAIADGGAQTAGKVRFRVGATEIVSASALSATTWYRIVARYDGSNLMLDINEAAETDVAKTGSIPTGSSHITMGVIDTGASATNCYNGKQSWIGVWSRSLTDTEVSTTLPAYLTSNS